MAEGSDSGEALAQLGLGPVQLADWLNWCHQCFDWVHFAFLSGDEEATIS